MLFGKFKMYDRNYTGTVMSFVERFITLCPYLDDRVHYWPKVSLYTMYIHIVIHAPL